MHNLGYGELDDLYLIRASTSLRNREERKGFDTLVILVAWLIWKEIKELGEFFFYHRASSVEEIRCLVEDEVIAWFHAGFRSLEGITIALGRTIVSG